jgi:hypothetical protein
MQYVTYTSIGIVIVMSPSAHVETQSYPVAAFSNWTLSPVGVPVQSEADCRCSPGFGYNPAEDVCSPCGQGEYKALLIRAKLKKVPSLSLSVCIYIYIYYLYIEGSKDACSLCCVFSCSHPGGHCQQLLHHLPDGHVDAERWCYLARAVQMPGIRESK